MQVINFGIILVWFGSVWTVESSTVYDDRDLQPVLTPENHGSIILDSIAEILGLNQVNTDLWDLLGRFEICELSCNGKLCSCCQHIDIAVIHFKVCTNSRLNTEKKAIDLFMSTTRYTFLWFQIKLHKLSKLCLPIRKNSHDDKICMYTNIQDFGQGGFSLCLTTEFILKGLVVIQANFGCFDYDGEVIFNGDYEVDGQKVALLRVINPIQFVQLIKRIIFE